MLLHHSLKATTSSREACLGLHALARGEKEIAKHFPIFVN
jgi:hypothetical protein